MTSHQQSKSARRADSPRADFAAFDRAKKRLFWPFVLPALALYAVFMLAPTVATFWASLTEWRAQGDPMKFVGMRNYVRIFTNQVSQRAFINTMLILVVAGVAIFAIAFVITVFLREIRYRNAARSLLFFPYIITPVAIGIVLGLILAPKGLVNELLTKVGLTALATNWLASGTVFWTMIVTIVWVSTGFYVIILSSGVDRIPAPFYEVCRLSGASRWQTFRYVTLPMTWDLVTIAAVLWIVNSFKIFEMIIAFGSLGSSSVPPEIQNLAVNQYYLTVGGRYPAYAMGQGSAVGIMTLVLVAICVVLLRRIMRRDRIEF